MTDFSFLLNDGDKIKLLPAVYKVDLKDYSAMRQKHLPTVVKWDYIKHLIVTESGFTLWQISEKYLDSEEARAIGTLEPPVALITWIIQQS